MQAKQIKIHQQSAKIGPKQLGPFVVTEVRSDVDYKLALPPALKIYDVFHVDRLSPYKGNEINGQTPPPPEPVTVNGEEEYEVKYIRDSKLFGHTLNVTFQTHLFLLSFLSSFSYPSLHLLSAPPMS